MPSSGAALQQHPRKEAPHFLEFIDSTLWNAGGVLGRDRHFFDAHHGVEADYGYSLNTQNYASASWALGVKSYSHEISAAYVFRMPKRNFTPFVLAGAGGLIFDPNYFTGTSSLARAAFIYGGGADFNLSEHLFVRAEYRGFVYDSPTDGLTGLCRRGSHDLIVPNLPLASATGGDMQCWWSAPTPGGGVLRRSLFFG
jgi:hypothetical protein